MSESICKGCKYFKTIESDKLTKLEGKHNVIVNHGNMCRCDDGLYFKGKVEYCCKEKVGLLSMDMYGNVFNCGSFEKEEDE